MFALLISMPRFESINFYQNIPKIKLFLQKNENFLVCWGLRSQTPCLQELGASPPDPQNIPPLRISDYAPDVFVCCFYVILCKLILRLAGVYGFPRAAPSLNKFAHPCSRLNSRDV